MCQMTLLMCVFLLRACVCVCTGLWFFCIPMHTFLGWVCGVKYVCVLWSVALWISTSCITIQQRCAAARGLFSLIWRAAKRSLAGGWYMSISFFSTPHTAAAAAATAAAASAALSVSLTYSESLPSTDNTPNNRWATAGRKEIAWPYCLPSPPLCSSQIKGFLINWKVLCRGP